MKNCSRPFWKGKPRFVRLTVKSWLDPAGALAGDTEIVPLRPCGVGVGLGVSVGVAVGVFVGVALGVGELVGLGVAVDVGVKLGVGVLVKVGVGVSVGVGVDVSVAVGVAVGVLVGMGVLGVAVAVGCMGLTADAVGKASPSASLSSNEALLEGTDKTV